MRRTISTVLFTILLSSSVGLPDAAPLLSKRFEFQPGVRLDVGLALEGGLRLDSVRFELARPAGKAGRVSGQSRVEVSISNDSEGSQRVGIAVALFDDGGRLLAVASGGSRLLPIKPDRQSKYTLVFDDVNRQIRAASVFQISIEPR